MKCALALVLALVVIALISVARADDIVQTDSPTHFTALTYDAKERQPDGTVVTKVRSLQEDMATCLRAAADYKRDTQSLITFIEALVATWDKMGGRTPATNIK
jgi:hypothetical protein